MRMKFYMEGDKLVINTELFDLVIDSKGINRTDKESIIFLNGLRQENDEYIVYDNFEMKNGITFKNFDEVKNKFKNININ